MIARMTYLPQKFQNIIMVGWSFEQIVKEHHVEHLGSNIAISERRFMRRFLTIPALLPKTSCLSARIMAD